MLMLIIFIILMFVFRKKVANSELLEIMDGGILFYMMFIVVSGPTPINLAFLTVVAMFIAGHIVKWLVDKADTGGEKDGR